MDTIMEIVKNLDWTPLFISFKTGIVATVISFFWIICSTKSDTCGRTCQSDCGWLPDIADGTAADGCRIFPAFIIQ